MLKGQSANLPYDELTYQWIDRLEIQSGKLSPYFYSFAKPFTRQQVAWFCDSLKISGNRYTTSDFHHLNWLLMDNSEWNHTEAQYRKPLLRYFYHEKTALFSHRDDDVQIFINPVLNLNTGRDFSNRQDLYTNTRGAEAHGNLGKKVGFYSFIAENQMRAPSYLRHYRSITQVFPSAGLTKDFKGDGVDFLQARGYITASPIKQVNIQFGHDRHFFGDGYRSFILSDLPKENLFLKLTTRAWKFNYTNLFMQLSDYERITTTVGNRKKYMAFHHLGIQLFKNLEVGVFETVVFDRIDSNGISGPFEVNYLNPVIFYRSVEHGLNSRDNALIGANFKWNLLKRFQVYGQVTIDEFNLKELRKRDQWWANKYALQTGVKVLNVISDLDFQYEFNVARPYTFMHFRKTQNYTHFNTPLGHPLGANFLEHIAILRYQPYKRWLFQLTAITYRKGLDNDTTNWGGDVYRKRYVTFEREYGNTIAQGEPLRVICGELYVGYQVAHRVWLEASFFFRNAETQVLSFKHNHQYLAVGLRANMARPRWLW